MRLRGRLWRQVLAILLMAAWVVPVPAWSAPASVGTARGIRGVELSWDGGKSWLPLGAQVLPVMAESQLRSTTGGAFLDLTDGSRLSLLPFSALRLRDTGRSLELSLLYGRLTFRLPPQTRVEIRTTTSRLAPVRDRAMAGELFVGADGTMGLKMTQGKLEVRDLAGTARTLLASVDPVFLPKRPATPGPLFSTEVPATPPRDAKGIYTPRGESIGYLAPGAGFVVHLGFTADLTQPFPGKLVQLAMAKIPAEHRSDALPLFDVHGGYVGYVSGPTFYAQAQVAQVVEGAPPPLLGPGAITGGIVGASVGLPVVAGGTEGFGAAEPGPKPPPPPEGTPLRPVRR